MSNPSKFSFLKFCSDKGILKIADFGLSRSLGNPKQPSTPKVVTLWYRAPEVLFGSRIHTSAMDLWSAGCVFGWFHILLFDQTHSKLEHFKARNKIYKWIKNNQ